MAASSQSLEQQLLQSTKAQLTGYLTRWVKHYDNEVQSIMNDLSVEQDTPPALAFARLLKALFAIPITNPKSSLQGIRQAISQSLSAVDGEGNTLLMLTVHQCPEAFMLLSQIIEHPLFSNREALLQQQNARNETVFYLAMVNQATQRMIQEGMVRLSQIATVRHLGAQLLQGNYQNAENFSSRIRAFPVAMQCVLDELILQCSGDNNPNLMTLRAYLHQCGLGGPVNYPEAIRLYEQAIALDDAKAMSYRAYMHQSGLGGPVNYPVAIELYEQAIALGNAAAMTNRAYMHQFGSGGPVSYPTAIGLYEQAIALDNVSAMNNRAYLHQYGHGGPVNYPEAIRLFEQAIALGTASAMINRAYMHEHGHGGPVNYPEAIRLFEQAIALDNADNATAMFNRARMHRFGLGGPVNYPEAIKLYEQAIALDNATAMNSRAYMHERGHGGPVNYPAAIGLYEQAIALDNASAMNSLAYMHQGGHGGPVNYPEAIRLYEQAIALNNASAMTNRAYMHRFGLGGPVNYPEAIRLYEQAAQRGNRNAAEALRSNDIQRYINSHLNTAESPAVASSSNAGESGPKHDDKLDVDYVGQKILDLTRVICNDITGTRGSFNIKLTIDEYRIAEITKLFGEISAGSKIMLTSVPGTTTFQLTIENIGFDEIRTFSMPLTSDRPECEIEDLVEEREDEPQEARQPEFLGNNASSSTGGVGFWDHPAKPTKPVAPEQPEPEKNLKK